MKHYSNNRIRITVAALIAATGLAVAAPMFGALTETAADMNRTKAPRQEVQARYLKAEELQPQKLVRQISSGNNIQTFLAETAH